MWMRGWIDRQWDGHRHGDGLGDTMDNITINGTTFVGLTDWADEHNVDDTAMRRLRRYARKIDNGDMDGDNVQMPDMRKIMGTWTIDADATVDDIPSARQRGRGRHDNPRYIVYADDVDIERIRSILGPDNVIDPRERRARRKREQSSD
jgi:hypothetical protein